MTDLEDDLLDASSATTAEDWVERMAEIGQAGGWFRAVANDHQALFLDNGRSLLVTFDTHRTAFERPRKLPVGMDLADECDWSHLCILARKHPWFRSDAVYALFDQLIDEGFFDGFDRVLFYGGGPLGYAAAAFSVAAPGARVLLLNPIATQSPGLAGWDDRFREAKRMDFATRYGFAPDMVEAASDVTVIADPCQKMDAMHSALFTGPHIRHFTARRGGSDLEAQFSRMGILNHLLAAAMEGSLTLSRFATLWRRRRSDGTYLRHLQMSAAAHPAREIAICRNVVARLDQKRFRRRLAELVPGEGEAGT
ncbi:phosphoadenosine phosphosulfate reductase [Rhodobacter sp. KR11]|jgi:hypothetical protein|uniref:phosphoadenosine phosphosulfate reductase n=1 Tax=Rhodobacter sp. KR11 TaxID=2974588 RepID=UPI002221D7CD|nr:phosphoadenosine phosphosulfate reductase [Rhodobacter sp. KR11]MCW1917850.1 phosphoadenosine phosphosulfate reductase [Rhodobacter sp. KR11]